MPLQAMCTHENIVQRCHACQNCETHCSCTRCRSCEFKFSPEEICSNCGLCGEGCCECARCNGGCGVFLNQRDDHFELDTVEGVVNRTPTYCNDCLKCPTCCTCYTCRKCKVNFFSRRKEFCVYCKHCDEHCTELLCVHGDGHTTCRKGFCTGCNKCKAHCHCAVCPLCQVKVSGVREGTQRYNEVFHVTEDQNIPPCRGCNRCCRCKMIGVEYRKGDFQLFHSVFSKGQFKRNPLRRHLSVEIEVDRFSTDKYSTAVNKALAKWNDPVVRDGSLDEGHSFEINTNPCNGDLFLDHMKDLCDGLAEINAGCTASCGLHVHINVKGTPLVKEDGTPVLRNGEMVYDQRSAYTHYDLRRLSLLYYFIEPAVYGLCSPVRLTSRYSKPCGDFYLSKSKSPKDYRKDGVIKMYRDGEPLPKGYDPSKPRPKSVKKKTLLRYDTFGAPVYGFLTTKPQSEFKRIGSGISGKKKEKYHKIRYNSLNLHSFFMRGTVEFRHKEGTVSYSEITNWALICGHIVEAASKMTEAQIRALPKNPREALLAILPPELQQYAQRKWEVQDLEQPRFIQMIEEQWRNKINYEV